MNIDIELTPSSPLPLRGGLDPIKADSGIGLIRLTDEFEETLYLQGERHFPNTGKFTCTVVSKVINCLVCAANDVPQPPWEWSYQKNIKLHEVSITVNCLHPCVRIPISGP